MSDYLPPPPAPEPRPEPSNTEPAPPHPEPGVGLVPEPVPPAPGAAPSHPLATATRVVYLVAAVVVTVCLVFITFQQRHQTQLLRRQGCLQQASYIRELEPSTESSQQLLAQARVEVRACVGMK